jgi:hypothetical protein
MIEYYKKRHEAFVENRKQSMTKFLPRLLDESKNYICLNTQKKEL